MKNANLTGVRILPTELVRREPAEATGDGLLSVGTAVCCCSN